MKFLARGRGYSLYLLPTEAVTVLWTVKSGLAARTMSVRNTGAVRMKFVGANHASQIVGVQQLPGRVNYFIGRDPRQWRAGIPTYASVRYRSIYEGIDLIYYGTQAGDLEYDFVVTPGADPTRIAFRFQGADGIDVDGRGNLMLYVAGAKIKLRRPSAYQEFDGARKEIPASYLLKSDQLIGFRVGSFDVTRPLIIDPVLAYSTFLGGMGDEIGFGIAADSTGAVYVTGVTNSVNFPTANAVQINFGGGDAGCGGYFPCGDAFVTKLNAAGTALVYSTYLGGSADDEGHGIVDANGNAYITGITKSNNFPTTAGAFQTTAPGFPDAFVTKLNATGTLAYSTYLGGVDRDEGYAIAVDGSGNTFVAGATTRFFPVMNPFQPTPGGGFYDAFVAKLNSTGSGLIYSSYLGGNQNDLAFGIALDSADNAYITGTTWSTNFPTMNPFQANCAGGCVSEANDVFLTKVNPAGSALVYSTYLGGSNRDYGFAVVVDTLGNAYITGSTASRPPNPIPFPTTAGAFQTSYGGDNFDAFVTRFNAAGSGLVYSSYLGGSGLINEAGRGIAVDSSSNAYVAGYTSSTDFPIVNPIQATKGAGFDVFVSKVNPAGSALFYSTFVGGSGDDWGLGWCCSIAVDRARNAYVTGATASRDFLTVRPIQPFHGGGFDDGLVLKIATPTFADVPVTDWGYNWIEQIFLRNVTAGCALDPTTGERRYCPDNFVTRREMAVFIVKSMGQAPVSPCTGTFSDVPTSDWGCGWIERIAQLNITAGCATNPLRYCPDNNVTRREMAVFLNRAANQAECTTCGPTFADVPQSDWGYGWIERLFQRGITAGCATNPLRYCPDNNVTRREMAVFIVRNFFP